MGLLFVAGEPAPTTDGMAWAVLAGVVGIVGLGCLFLALSRSAMGIVAPLAALMGAAIPALVGILGGDPLNATLAVGMLVALGAIVVMALPEGIGGRPVVPAFHGSRPVEWLLILGAGLGSATFYLATDRAHAAGLGVATTLIGVRLASLATVIAGLALAATRARRSGARSPVRITRLAVVLGAVASLGDTFGTVAYLQATTVGVLSVTVVLASFAPIGTAILARLVLHERLSPVRLVGVGLAVGGAALIALGAAGG